MITIMSTVVASILIALAGPALAFIGVIYGGRREHAQWLRNARVSAYQTLTTVVTEMQAERMLSKDGQLPKDDFATRSQRLAAAQGAVLVVGPASIANAAISLAKAAAYARTDEKPVRDALVSFVDEARKVLRSAH